MVLFGLVLTGIKGCFGFWVVFIWFCDVLCFGFQGVLEFVGFCFF